jgi:hypothetical protein
MAAGAVLHTMQSGAFAARNLSISFYAPFSPTYVALVMDSASRFAT